MLRFREQNLDYTLLETKSACQRGLEFVINAFKKQE